MAIFYNRLGHIEIVRGVSTIFSTKSAYDTSRLRALHGIDFKFNCKKVSDMTTTASNAKVSILGLSRETVKFLTTLDPPGVERQKAIRVRVYASYEDFGENLIFDGDITNAVPNVPPNNWIDIEAFVGNYRNNALITKTINGETTIKDLIEDIADTLYLTPRWLQENTKGVKEEQKRKIWGFDSTGTLQDLLTAVNKVSNFIVHQEGLELVIRYDFDKATGNRNSVPLISEKTGMVGIPKIMTGRITSDGRVAMLQVTTFINPSLRLWDEVYLQSVYIPDANGVYTIIDVEYNGHYRGTEWYQTMTLTSANARR